jgi:hypothetical protein
MVISILDRGDRSTFDWFWITIRQVDFGTLDLYRGNSSEIWSIQSVTKTLNLENKNSNNLLIYLFSTKFYTFAPGGPANPGNPVIPRFP